MISKNWGYMSAGYNTIRLAGCEVTRIRIAENCAAVCPEQGCEDLSTKYYGVRRPATGG